MVWDGKLAIGLLSLLVTAPLLSPAPALAQMKTFKAARGAFEIVWSAPLGEVDVDPDEIDGISVDPDGNTIVSGVFRNRIRIGDQNYLSRGEGDIFLASYSAAGAVNWSKHIGGTGDDNTYDLTTDGAGNIYASGWFSESVDFGGTVLRSKGSVDMFVAKYAPDGRLTWAKSFGGVGGDGGNEIAVLANGEIAVSAISESDFEVEGRKFSHGGGARDSYLIRMHPDGRVVWVRPMIGPGAERIRAVAMNDAGDIFVGLQYTGELNTGGKRLKSFGRWDGAIVKLSSAGEVVWLLPVGGRGTDNVRGLAAGPNGSVYASGVIHGSVFMINRKIPALGRKGEDFLLRISAGGKPEWVVSMAGPGRAAGAEMQSDQRGVIVSGVIEGEVTIRRNAEKLDVLRSHTGLPTSYLAAFTDRGEPRFIYMAEPLGAKAGALGDVLSVSRDGRYLAQALRFRSKVRVGETEMSTPSERDSAVVFFRLNGG